MSLDILRRVWEQAKEVKGSDLVALLALADRAQDDGYCFPGIDDLADRCRCTARNVMYIIERLEQSGHVYVEHHRGRSRSNEYVVAVGMNQAELAGVLVARLRYSHEDALTKAEEFFDSAKNVKPPSCFDGTENEAENVKAGAQNVKPASKNVKRASSKNVKPASPESSVESSTESSKKQRRKRKGVAPPAPDPSMEHFAVRAYRAKFKLTPNEDQRKHIMAVVKDEGLWVEAMTAWNLKRYKPTNVLGMLDFYQHPEKWQQGGTYGQRNGTGATASSPAPGREVSSMSPDEWRAAQAKPNSGPY